MDEYISKKAVIELLESLGGCDAPKGSWEEGIDSAIDTAISQVEDILSSDVAPIRHGKWMYERTIPTIGKVYRCNNCNRLIFVKDERISNINDYPYCHCGAKMDLE